MYSSQRLRRLAGGLLLPLVLLAGALMATPAVAALTPAAPTVAGDPPLPAYPGLPFRSDRTGTLAVSTTPTPCDDNGADKTLTRDQVLTRAGSWLSVGIPYSQQRCYRNQYGDYRTDCSGFVAMAWGLGGSGSAFWTGNLLDRSDVVARSTLQPGDALLRHTGDPSENHVALFVRWADSAHTQPTVIEQTGSQDTIQRTWTASYASLYTPVRYINIEENEESNLVGTGPAAVLWGSNLNVYNVSRQSGKVYQRSYVTDAGWTSSWLDLGGEMSGRVAAIVYRGALNLYAVNRNNGSIYQKAYKDGAWTSWENLGGAFRGSPTVVQYGTALNIYGFSKDKGYLYQKSYVPGSGFGTWERIGDGQFYGSPAAVTMPDNTLHVAGLSPTGRLYLNTYTNGWQGWYQPSGTGQFQPGTTPALVPRGTTLHLYAIGIGQAHAWENKQTSNSTWNGWTTINTGQFEGSLNATATSDGSLNLFAISPGNRVYHNRYQTNWTGWDDLSGEMTGRPEAIELNGTLYMFTTNLDNGSTWVRTRTTTGWQSWQSLA